MGQRIPGDFRVGAVVISIALAMCALFAAAYTVALGQPLPRHVSLGVVGPGPAGTSIIESLEAAGHHDFEVRDVATRDAGVAAIDDRTVSGVLDVTHSPPQLLISSASDASTARTLTELNRRREGGLVEIVDLHPLPANDPQGLAAFYLTIAATILGFVTTMQLKANIKETTLVRWSVLVAVLSVLGGLTLATVSIVVLHALAAPFAQVWTVLSMQIGVAALFNSAMLVLVRRWAIIPTWGLFIVFGNTSSGGAVAASLLPQPFALLNGVLPAGATVTALHAAAYFPQHQHWHPYLVLTAWLCASAAAMVLGARRLGRTPVG